MNCEEFQARYLAGELPGGDQGHLASCPTCREAAPGLDHLRARLREQVLWEEPSPDLGERVVAAVAVEARPQRLAARRPRRIAWVAAVALVAALGVGGWLRAGAPDWQIDLAATDNAPLAVAHVAGWNTEYGTKMRLEVEGLEPVGSDAYYEVWLTSPDGRHVSAGTFRGPGEIVLWAGVTRAEFPRIWVTREPTDHDPAPSGETVLDTRF